MRPLRILPADEAARRVEELLRPEDQSPEIGDDSTLPHRIMVMWRLVRVAARVTGLCAEDETLDQATEIEPDPWTHPIAPPLTPSQQALLRRGAAGALLNCVAKGMSLLPPDDPQEAVNWCQAMTLIAMELNMLTTQDGRIGFNGLLHPKTCQYSGVTIEHILALEELLVDEAQKLIIENGERPAIEHFRVQYSFTRKEAVALIRLARADALTMSGNSVDEDRALMIAQLKDLVARAKEEVNSDRELKALKELAKIQGLTRTAPEDIQRDFMAVIAAVADRQDRRALESPKTRLPATIEAEYTVTELKPVEVVEDPEDLDAFDAENHK